MMPPAISDDEHESDGSGPDAVPAKNKPVKQASEDEDSEDEGDAEDEFQVEKIMKHNFKNGSTIYQIKWLGYEHENDLTWEPVENLEGAKEILDAYHAQIGGTPEPPARGSKKAGRSKVGKRTASEAFDTPQPSASKGRGRKSDGDKMVDSWQPPAGSWEDDIVRVAAIVEGDELERAGKPTKDPQSLYGLLEWKNGKKTQHLMKLLRKKCPQRLLDYYEQHLLKPKLEEMANAKSY